MEIIRNLVAISGPEETFDAPVCEQLTKGAKMNSNGTMLISRVGPNSLTNDQIEERNKGWHANPNRWKHMNGRLVKTNKLVDAGNNEVIWVNPMHFVRFEKSELLDRAF